MSLLISLVFHGLIPLAPAYFAVREGLLGMELKKIAVEPVRQKPPEMAKEPEPEPGLTAAPPMQETPVAE